MLVPTPACSCLFMPIPAHSCFPHLSLLICACLCLFLLDVINCPCPHLSLLVCTSSCSCSFLLIPNSFLHTPTHSCFPHLSPLVHAHPHLSLLVCTWLHLYLFVCTCICTHLYVPVLKLICICHICTCLDVVLLQLTFSFFIFWK